MITVENNRSTCPVSTALEIVGDQWSMLIIRDLFLQRVSFKDFLSAPENISTNILTDRLHKLLRYKLIAFQLHPKNKKIKQYYLTEAGLELYPLIYELSMWSKKHLKMTFHPLSEAWYQSIEGMPREEIIQNDIQSYKDFKEKLLSKSNQTQLHN